MSREIRIGLLAIVAIGTLIWGYKFLLGNNLLSPGNTYYVEYTNVDGLQVSDPVTINGYQIGTVQKIYLKPEDLQTVVVVLGIQSGIQLPKNTVAQLYSGSVMGGKAISLEYEGICEEDCLPSGSQLAAREYGLIKSLVDPDELDQYLKTIQEGVTDALDSVDAHLQGDGNSEIAETFHDLRSVIANLSQTTAHMNHLLASSSSKLVGAMSNLESVTKNIEANNQAIAGFLNNAENITAQLAAARLDTTVIRTNRTLNNTSDVMTSLQETVNKADETFKQLSVLLQDINMGKGTLGSLLKDEELYGNLNLLSKNLQLLLQDVRLRPTRYVNVSVFGKKNRPYTVPENDPAFDTIPE